MKPYIISITGPSGSGKTALVSKLSQLYPNTILQSIRGDSFYKDRSNYSLAQRSLLNYDHPDAFEFDLLNETLLKLQKNQSVEIPVYDFKTHTRSPDTITINPAPIIIVEGILILADPVLRKIANCNVFINTPTDICLLRRIRRDCIERGRDTDSVLNQYEQTVRPMLIENIVPLKQYAHQCLPDGGWNEETLEWMCSTIDQCQQNFVDQ
jgi:uridine kinase